jgi:hypothetical protein
MVDAGRRGASLLPILINTGLQPGEKHAQKSEPLQRLLVRAKPLKRLHLKTNTTH